MVLLRPAVGLIVDFALAAPQGMSSVFFNKGENCIAAGRLFVEESIHDEFISRVVSGDRSTSTFLLCFVMFSRIGTFHECLLF